MQNGNLIWPALNMLVRPGIVGNYTHVEITEIVGFSEEVGEPVNILNLMVEEDRKEKELPP